MRAAIDNALIPVHTYLADHGPLNIVLLALMVGVVIAACAGLLRARRRVGPPGHGLRPVTAPVLPSQRGLQEPARTRSDQ